MAKEQGHLFLKKLGKNRLRPGGVKGTNFLLGKIDFSPGTRILEVACNKGVNLLSLAKAHPDLHFVGLDLDKTAIAEAQEACRREGLTNCHFQQGSAFDLPFEDNAFDLIINEAMLTMFPNKSKERALKEYSRVLEPGGQLLTHDIALIADFETTRQTLSQAINVNVSPLPKEDWLALLQGAQFQVADSLQDKLTLMTPKGMIEDEGLVNSLRIIKNGLKAENRQQFTKMGRTFWKLRHKMNFICFESINTKEK